MTVKEFIRTLEDYYEQPYRSKVKVNYLAAYLQRLGVDFAIVLDAVIRGYKGQYGKLPDVAAIEEIMAEPEMAIHRRLHIDANQNVWSRGKQIGHYDECRFIPMFADGVPDHSRLPQTQDPWKYVEYLEGRGLLPAPEVETRLAVVSKR